MKIKGILQKTAAALTAFTCAFGMLRGSPRIEKNTKIMDISLTAEAATTYNVTFPVNNGCKIYRYQKYDPRYKDHDGVDIHSSGNDTIYAAKGGTVYSTANKCNHIDYAKNHTDNDPHYSTGGNSIVVKGDDGMYYWYFHLKQNSLLVSKGDKVVAGQAIATMGSSGQSTGKHLHFVMTKSTSYKDRIIANPVGTYSGQVNYSNGPYNTTVAKVIVRFHRNTSSSDTTAVSETFTAGVKNQKFGYNSSGKGNYDTMNPGDKGFGKWTRSGYKLLGWSTSKSDKTAKWQTYSGVTDSWIKSNAPFIDLYAIWEKDVTITSLSIETPALFNIYPTNGKLNTEGLVLSAKYSSGTTEKITEGFTASADLSKTGDTVVTVKYNNASTTYPIKVTDFFSGSGTEASPYLIKNSADLKLLSDVVNNLAISPDYKSAYYRQTADIDLNNSLFIPIGVYVSNGTLYHNISFDGIYDGNNHKITNLFVNSSNSYAGLFGRTQRHSVIKNLSVYGNVKSSGTCTGGIAGEQGYSGEIINCSFNGSVEGTMYTGGIVGNIQGGGTVSGCYVNANINCDSTVENSYAGGIASRVHIGNASNAEDAFINNCYFAGTVSGKVTGGIIGKTDHDGKKENTATYKNNYYLKSAASAASGDKSMDTSGGTFFTEEEIRRADEVLGSPFAYNWSKRLNDGYPVFEWQTIIQGDADNNGTLSVADAVMLQKWLIGSGELTAWENADLCQDGVIDVFDMVEMRKLLIKNK